MHVTKVKLINKHIIDAWYEKQFEQKMHESIMKLTKVYNKTKCMIWKMIWVKTHEA